MNEELFRKKSLDKVKSPDNLDDYIQIANPGVWLIIISAIVLLVGACIWGTFGHIDSIIDTVVKVDEQGITCSILEEDVSTVMVGMTVKVGNNQLEIIDIGQKTATGYTCILKTDSSIEKGFYNGKIVIQSVKPFAFVFN